MSSHMSVKISQGSPFQHLPTSSNIFQHLSESGLPMFAEMLNFGGQFLDQNTSRGSKQCVFCWLKYHSDLVGGFNTPQEYDFVNWDDYSQYMEKQKMFQTTNQFTYYLDIFRSI